MSKTLKYVSEFSFPSDGKHRVKGYARGSAVKKQMAYCGDDVKKSHGGEVFKPKKK